MIEYHTLDCAITAAGLTLVEFYCPECGYRWWIEQARIYKGALCMHGANLRQRTGYKTHIRLSDF